MGRSLYYPCFFATGEVLNNFMEICDLQQFTSSLEYNFTIKKSNADVCRTLRNEELISPE